MVNHNYDYFIMYYMYIKQFIGLFKTIFYYSISFFDYRKPVIWNKEDIVFFCSYGNIPGEIPWDFTSLNKGCGGSEHSILNLSKELSKKYKITIFNNVPKEIKFNNIVFKPCKNFNFNDKFNVLISWRLPWLFSLGKLVNSSNNILWLHDATPLSTQKILRDYFGNFIENLVYRFTFFSNNINSIVVPSKFMEKLFNDTKKKFNFNTNIVRIPNGIMDYYDLLSNNNDFIGNINYVKIHKNKSLKIIKKNKSFKNLISIQNNELLKRNINRIIWTVNPDRGIEILLKNWQELLKINKKIELQVYSNFKIYKNTDKYNIVKLLKQKNIYVNDLIGHDELIKKYNESSLFIYPCKINEAFSICSWEALKNGCITIISNNIATALSELKEYGADIVNNEYLLLEKIKYYISNKNNIVNKRYELKNNKKYILNWNKVSKKWENILN